MANSFQELKNSRKANFEKLQEELAKMATGQKFVKESEDETFWFPTADKAGNGSAVIRFLPAPQGEAELLEKALGHSMPVVKVFSHGFEGPNGWYIEKSLNSLRDANGEPLPDPVAKMNRKLWEAGEKTAERAFVSGNPTVKPAIPGSKRKLSYYANIYIVKDSAKKENEGQVKKYKFGARIHDKILTAYKPKFEDVLKFDPFDLFEGANFRLAFSNNEKGLRTYEASGWDYVEGDDNIKRPRGALFKKEADIEKVWLQCHSLYQFIDPKGFKSYEDLEARLRRIMGTKFGIFGELKVEFVETTPPWEDENHEEAVLETAGATPQETPSTDDLQWYRDLAKQV